MSFERKVLDFTKLSETITRLLPIIDNRKFKGEVVYLDFNDYRNCEFEDCTIVLEYGVCRMSHCTFNRCKFEAKTGSPASFVLQMDRMLRESIELDKHK